MMTRVTCTNFACGGTGRIHAPGMPYHESLCTTCSGTGSIERHETNVEFLMRVMDFAKSGPLMQAFVLEACAKYAEACAKADPATFDTPMLNGAAWHRCAVELRDEIKRHLATN